MSGSSSASSNGDTRLGGDPRRLAEDVRQAQALGFRVATDVATSILPYLYDDAASPSTPPSAFVRDLLARGDQLADGVASVVRGMVGPLVDYVEAALASRIPPVPASDVVCVAEPGQTATAMATVVVPSDVSAGRFWVTALMHPRGATVDGERIRCIPDDFDQIARGTSMPVRLVIDVPPDALPGSYVGHLLCTELPHALGCVRLELPVESDR